MNPPIDCGYMHLLGTWWDATPITIRQFVLRASGLAAVVPPTDARWVAIPPEAQRILAAQLSAANYAFQCVAPPPLPPHLNAVFSGHRVMPLSIQKH